MSDILYQWPATARFGRPVPKTRFYEHARITGPLREAFVSDISRIIWSYKLAESTINLPGSPSVPEIQVFQIDTKGDDISEPVLTAIDTAVRTPIIFEITRSTGEEASVRMTATPKRLGSGSPKLGTYYSTEWQPDDTARQPLPTAITLPDLYTALLEPITPVTARPGDDVSELTNRLEAFRKLERQIATLERKIRNEPQLNRKIELRRTLKAKQAELEQVR